MRHNADVKSFNRPYNQRVALMRGLVVSLVEHERIKTTLAKAKELRRVAERSVTLAKRGSLHARRTLISRLANEDTVIKLFSTLAPRFKDRNGGYTRIYKLDPRPGDNAEMALIEFLGAEIKAPGQKASEQKEAKTKKATAKKAATGEKKAAKAKKAKKD